MTQTDWYTMNVIWPDGSTTVSAARRRTREQCLEHVAMQRRIGYNVNCMIHVKPKVLEALSNGALRAPYA